MHYHLKIKLFFIIVVFLHQGFNQRLLAHELVQNADTVIRGIVIADSASYPLSSVTVTEKSSGMSVKTDERGNFFLRSKKQNTTLVVSHVGYTSQTIPITSNTAIPLRIVLKRKTQDLGEVVVVSTGYERIPKERSTGSFDLVNKTNFNKQVSTEVLSRLEAVASGFQVDRTTSGAGIVIRGLSTIQGPRSPLVIVDNFPYDGDINNINPNDVDNITILKDAAAASVWGSRAGNGVIVITTKKGRLNEQTTVEFNANVSLLSKPDLDWIPQISASDLIDTEIFLYGQGYFDSKFNDFMRPPLSPVVEILRKKSLGEISASDSASQIDALRHNDVRDAFKRYFYRQGINQQYAVNARGGSDKLAWSMGAGIDRNLSNLSAKYDRLNLHWENTWSALKDLRISTSMYYTESNNTSGKPGYNQVNPIDGRLPVYAMMADEQGNALPVIKNYRQLYVDTAGSGALLDWNYYPLTDHEHSPTTTGMQDLLARAGIQYKISNSLSAEVLYQYERQKTFARTLFDEESYFARDLINSFSQINAASGSVRYIIPKGSILDLSNTDLVSHQGRGQLNFNKSWEDFSVSAIAGGEIRQSKTSAVLNRTYGYNDEILTIVNVDLANPYPHYVTGWNSFIPTTAGMSSTTNRFVSTYSNAAFTYKDRYTVSASARRDASNLFGLNTNDKWTPLWSSGLSWDISKEPFYKSALFPYLRVRATYGVSGNVNQSQSAVTVLTYTGSSVYTQTPMAFVSQYNNPELRWEKIKMLNIGVDFSLRDVRISGSLEYFSKKGVDLYGPSLVDYTSGLGTATVVKNVASMQGNGVDLQLSSININKQFGWTTNLNASYYKDRVSDYYLASEQGSNYITGSLPGVSGVEGKPVYAIFSYDWAGLDPNTGNPMGYANGKPSSDYNYLSGPNTTIDSLLYNGPAMPTFYGSIINTFSWKGISLSTALTYKAGHYFRRESINYSSLFSGRSGHSDFANRWQQPGDEASTNVPSMIYPAVTSRDAFYTGSAVLVEKGDFIRLQYVTLNYDVKRIVTSEAFERIELYLNCSNLGIIWKNTRLNIDPDYPTANSRAPKTYAAGLRITL